MIEQKPVMPEVEFVPEKINGNFKGKDILSIKQFDIASLEKLFTVANQMKDIAKNARPSKILEGNTVALLFWEPSTRTLLSTDGGVKQLGGQTIILPANSSEKKEEPFEDTIDSIEAYCDAIVIRHKDLGSAEKAAQIAKFVPAINAGDGKGGHPTQAIGDLYTLREKKGTLSGLTGVVARDLKNGRTVHSLLEGLSLYPNNAIYLLAKEEMKLPKIEIEKFRRLGLKIFEIENEADIPQNCDFWYWTRVQKERFSESELAAYERLNSFFVMDNAFVKKYGNPNLVIMHPRPIVGEIAKEVYDDPRAVFNKEQPRNGQYTRMALLALVLGKIESFTDSPDHFPFAKS